jgi:hypothetical protein
MEELELPTKSRDAYKRLEHIGRGTYGDVSTIALLLLGGVYPPC